ncbi:hypothetical protein DPMN_093840, partial [Dreissena polymorpha]
DSVQEIRKLNTFLGTGCEEALIEKIALACSFHNLKKADAEFKENPFKKDKRFDMYRKVTPGAVTWMQILSRWAKMGAARETRLELTSLEGAG